MAGAVVEHPNSDSDTKFTASTDQEVCLARIEQLGSWIDANGLWTSGLDDEDLRGGDILEGADEVGERDGDRGKLEWFCGVRIEKGIEETGQLRGVLLDQKRDVDDSCSGGIRRESDWLAGLLVVYIETDNSKINATSRLKMRSNPSAPEVSSHSLADARAVEAKAFTAIDLTSMLNSADRV